MIIKFIIVAVLILVVSFITKKAYSIEREILINKPVTEVFDYVRYLKNQDYYSKWVMTDPHMKKEFTGTDGTEGFAYAWDGNKKAGAGKQTIKKLVPNEQVECEIVFLRPISGIAQTWMQTSTSGNNQTKVKWGMTGTTPFLMSLFVNKILGKDMEESLTLLKNILEK